MASSVYKLNVTVWLCVLCIFEKKCDMDTKRRYDEKVQKFCMGLDPASLNINICVDALPRNLQYFDIVNYCIDKDSAYTYESFKSYKSLEGYRYFESGFVMAIGCKKISGGSIVLAKVKHSMRMNATPNASWVSIDEDGIVLTGHCNCMAGMGEVCSHVSAILFTLEEWGRRSTDVPNAELLSCTDVLSTWLVPACKKVEMAKISDIEFHPANPRFTSVPLPELLSQFEIEVMDEILRNLYDKGVVIPLMTLREPFASRFVEKDSESLLMNKESDNDESNLAAIKLYLTAMFRSDFTTLTLEDLQKIGENIKISYAPTELEYIEYKTRQQSDCTLWYRFRAGRVTGSTFLAVCRTNIETPSMSLIEKICFPETKIFRSEATEYGKKYEKTAIGKLIQLRLEDHPNYRVSQCGFVVNNNYAHCGVSPDGIIECDCCEKGVVEVKCPFTLNEMQIKTYLKKRTCPIEVVEEDDEFVYKLKKKHEYYFQVQMEMFLCDSQYCDFIVWSPKESIVIRVLKDQEFWDENYPKTVLFFKKVLLPELLGTFYSTKKREAKKGRKPFTN